MQYWLIKSDPETYGWEDFEKVKKDCWDGVRNFAARKNLMRMEKGDLCLFYHSQKNPHVVGVAEVIKEHYPDPTSSDDRWVAVDVKLSKKLTTPVKLQEIRDRKSLKDMVLVNNSRLSVQPVRKTEFDTIVKMGS